MKKFANAIRVVTVNLIVLVVLLIIAALMFGGFQKGTKYGAQAGLNPQHVAVRLL